MRLVYKLLLILSASFPLWNSSASQLRRFLVQAHYVSEMDGKPLCIVHFVVGKKYGNRYANDRQYRLRFASERTDEQKDHQFHG